MSVALPRRSIGYKVVVEPYGTNTEEESKTEQNKESPPSPLLPEEETNYLVTGSCTPSLTSLIVSTVSAYFWDDGN